MSLVFTAVALSTLGALVYRDRADSTVNVVSGVNGKTYRVMPLPDRQRAADALAALEDRAKRFLKAAAVKYPQELAHATTWSGTISEIPKGDAIAYTIEKRDVFMCIRDEDGKIHPIDDLFFVFLHEISHINNATYGHGDDFWKRFKNILEISDALGYLKYKNYDMRTVNVCGQDISSNPLTCVKTGRCESDLRPIRPISR